VRGGGEVWSSYFFLEGDQEGFNYFLRGGREGCGVVTSSLEEMRKAVGNYFFLGGGERLRSNYFFLGCGVVTIQ